MATASGLSTWTWCIARGNSAVALDLGDSPGVSVRRNRRELPVAVNVANFAPAVAGQPVLLSPDEVQTVFHEFGSCAAL